MVTLKFDPLPIGQETPDPDSDLSLPGTINPYQTGMTVTVTRFEIVGGQQTDPQVVNSSIPAGGTAGQPWTFASTVPASLLDPDTSYLCEVTASVAHMPDTIAFTTAD